MLTLRKLPESMVIIGAGAVGVEFATIMHSFGKQVTILEMLPKLVPLEDEDVSKELQRTFKKKKIKAITEASVTGIEKTPSGVKVSYTRKDKEQIIEADKALMAIGRKPNTDNLGLETAGVKTDRGFVIVNDNLQTSVENIWAIGDIIPTPQLAHSASAEGIYVVEMIAGEKPEKINFNLIPAATYSEPQISSVGLTESEAITKGHKVKTGTCRFNILAKSNSLILLDYCGDYKTKC